MSIESIDNGSGKSKLSSAGSWLLRNILRTLTAVVLGMALGAGLFYTGRSFLGLPAAPDPSVGESTVILEVVEARVDELESSQDVLVQRLDSLESENTAQQDAILSLLDQAGAESEASSDGVIDSAAMDETLAILSGELDVMSLRLEALESSSPNASSGGGIEQEWVLMRSMAVLLRAKISLLEDDYGQAQQDVEAAREILSALADLPDMDIIISRLDRALEEVAETPQIAEGDLDIAWNLLIDFSEQLLPITSDS